MPTQTEPRTVGTAVLQKLDVILTEIETLRKLADLLGSRMPDGTSFFDRVAHLLSLIVEGTEVTHKSLETLQSSLADPRFQAAMREAFRGD